MYIVGTNNKTVYQYTLSTAWDVSTASYASKSVNVSAQDSGPTSVAFSSDGTKMYVAGTSNDMVYQYTLSTAWDVSTASYASNSVSFSAEETQPSSLAFNYDGTKMYVLGSANDAVYQYELNVISNGVIYYEFSTVSSRYWRFEVAKASAPSSLGIVALGEKLAVPESVQVGFSPANLARTNKYLNSTSDEGHFLGRRLIRNGSEMSLSFDLMTPAFVRNSWDVFIQHAEVKPFFFAWDYANYPTEVAFCWTSGNIPKPVYSQPNFMRVALNAKANT